MLQSYSHYMCHMFTKQNDTQIKGTNKISAKENFPNLNPITTNNEYIWILYILHLSKCMYRTILLVPSDYNSPVSAQSKCGSTKSSAVLKKWMKYMYTNSWIIRLYFQLFCKRYTFIPIFSFEKSCHQSNEIYSWKTVHISFLD